MYNEVSPLSNFKRTVLSLSIALAFGVAACGGSGSGNGGGSTLEPVMSDDSMSAEPTLDAGSMEPLGT